MTKSKRVAFYLRVSTDGQTTENQRRELERVAAHRNWTLDGVYLDHGVSGAKGREKRPAFDRLCKDALRGKFEVVAAWSVDRLGRSLLGLIAFLGELDAPGIEFYLHPQADRTAGPAGQAEVPTMGAL